VYLLFFQYNLYGKLSLNVLFVELGKVYTPYTTYYPYSMNISQNNILTDNNLTKQ